MISSSLGSAVIAAIISSGIVWYTNTSDIEAKYVDVATRVLSTNKECGDKEIRAWAVDVLNEYMPKDSLKLSADVRQRLIDCRTKIPIMGWGNAIDAGPDIASGTGTVGTTK